MKHKLRSYFLFSLPEVFLLIKSRFKFNIAQGYIDMRWGFEILLSEGYIIKKHGKGNILLEYKVADFYSNFYFRRSSTDYFVFCQVIKLLEYKTACDAMSGRDVKYIMDCGANAGYTTLYFKNRFPNAKIISIEPDSVNFNTLKENLFVNNFLTDYCVNGGVWSKDTFLSLNNEFRDGREWALTLAETEDAGIIRVYKIATIMQMFKIPTIDILKIDIEGGEKTLFDHDESLSEFLPFVKQLVIEIHDEVADRNLIQQKLLQYNFEIFETDVLTIATNRNFTDVKP